MVQIQATPARSMAPSSFKLDEGYSEDSRTPSGTGSEVMMLDDSNTVTVEHEAQHSAARQWLLSQPADFRSRRSSSLSSLCEDDRVC